MGAQYCNTKLYVYIHFRKTLILNIIKITNYPCHKSYYDKNNKNLKNNNQITTLAELFFGDEREKVS